MNQNPREKKRIFFIVNPISGTGKHRNIDREIKKYLDHRQFDFQIVFTEYRGHATILTEKAIAERAFILVAVGGDGTINEVSRALVGTDILLAVIPSGSGNGLARHLALPVNARKALQIINQGKSKRIDTATLNDRFFISMAGMGFDAHVARKFDQADKRGFVSYFRLTTSSYKNYKPKNYKLEIDGKEVSRRALMINFANSNQFGNNTTINPDAEIDDGLIDVCIVHKLPLWKLVLLSPLIWLKKFNKTPYVEVIKAREVMVRRKKGRYIHLDGDPEKAKKKLHVQVHPLSLRVIIP